MSIRPANAQSQVSTKGDFTPAKGFIQPQTVSRYATAPYPILNPPQLIAIDSVAFDTNVTNTVTFCHLPIRDTTVNPLAPSRNVPKTITILPQDTLLYYIVIQSLSAPVQITPETLDTTNLVFQGSVLGAGTYATFRARITAATPAQGVLVGQLYIQRGGGQ